VCDHDHRAALHQIGKSALHQGFGLGIEVGRSFVEDQNRGIL
jgi:hypothetical protein